MIKTEEILNIPVEEIMTKQVHTVDANDKMVDVRKIMAHKHIRHAPVMKHKKLIGILSLTDVQRLTFSDTYGEDELDIDDSISDLFTAESIMHRDPQTLRAGDSLKDAAKIFVNKEFHALPVVNGEELVGIITTTDILRFIISNS